MFSSSAFSSSLQQLATTVNGSDLIYFLLEDKMMGQQLADITKLVEGVNKNKLITHPFMSDSDKQDALKLFKLCGLFVRIRNRVAHDQFHVFPTEALPDRVEARRSTRWSKSNVTTTIGTIRTLDRMLFSAAVCMQILDASILSTRNGHVSLRESRARAEFDNYVEAMTAIQQNQDKTWVWEVTESQYR